VSRQSKEGSRWTGDKTLVKLVVDSHITLKTIVDLLQE